jgi:hypothetical protein
MPHEFPGVSQRHYVTSLVGVKHLLKLLIFPFSRRAGRTKAVPSCGIP